MGKLNFILQYMFGESLLAAPVITKDARVWSVYLPAGATWVDVGSTFQVLFSYYALKLPVYIIFVQYEESDGRFRIGFNGFKDGAQYV